MAAVGGGERSLVGVGAECCNGQSLVCPARGNDIAYQRYIARGAATVQVVEIDHHAAQQYLRYEQQRNADVNGHHSVKALRQQQAGQASYKGRSKEDGPPGEKQVAEAHDALSHQYEHARLQ